MCSIITVFSARDECPGSNSLAATLENPLNFWRILEINSRLPNRFTTSVTPKMSKSRPAHHLNPESFILIFSYIIVCSVRRVRSHGERLNVSFVCCMQKVPFPFKEACNINYCWTFWNVCDFINIFLIFRNRSRNLFYFYESAFWLKCS